MFILGFENIYLNTDGKHGVYKDAVDFSTVGYGHKITEKEIENKVFSEDELKNGLTEDRARQIFEQDLKHPLQSAKNISKYVKQKFDLNLNKDQLSAITSLIFNIGGGNWVTSPVFKNIKKTGTFTLDDMLFHTRDFKGNIIPGLVDRRKKEFNIYNGGKYEIKKIKEK